MKKKKAVKKKADNKIPPVQLGDWLDKVPKAVQEAAEDYDTAKTKAQDKLNSAKDRLIEKMRENDVLKVRIRNGEKNLVISAWDKISYEKPKEHPPE